MKKTLLFILFTALLVCSFVAVSGEYKTEYVNNWYEIFVRSFQDSNGDGIGDLPGVTERLDYLEDMGYNGIWLMPVMPSTFFSFTRSAILSISLALFTQKGISCTMILVLPA